MLFFALFSCTDHHSATLTPTSQLENIEAIELRWFSVTTLSIRFQNRLWVVDPFFSRPNGNALAANETGMNRMIESLGNHVDRIFVGHSHFDHILDLRATATHYNAPIYGSQTTCFLAGDLPCDVVDQGWQANIDGVTVTAIRTPHWRPDWNGVGSYEVLDSPSNDIAAAPNGGVISYHMLFPNGQSLLIQDSMGELDVPDGSDQNYRENLSFVETNPIDYWLTCGDCLEDAEELEAYIAILKPKVAVPIHWDGVFADPNAFPNWENDTIWEQAMATSGLVTQRFSNYATPMILPSSE